MGGQREAYTQTHIYIETDRHTNTILHSCHMQPCVLGHVASSHSNDSKTSWDLYPRVCMSVFVCVFVRVVWCEHCVIQRSTLSMWIWVSAEQQQHKLKTTDLTHVSDYVCMCECVCTYICGFNIHRWWFQGGSRGQVPFPYIKTHAFLFWYKTWKTQRNYLEQLLELLW